MKLRIGTGAVLAVLALAAQAQGATFCVNMPAGTQGCDSTSNQLQTTLDAAEANGQDDTVRIGPGTYTREGGFEYNEFGANTPVDRITIQGAGDATVVAATKPLLEPSVTTLSVTGSLTDAAKKALVQDLRVQISPDGNSAGLSITSGEARDFSVRRDTSTGSGNAVIMREDATLTRADILITSGDAAGVQPITDGDKTIVDSSIVTDQSVGIGSNVQDSDPLLDVRRSFIRADLPISTGANDGHTHSVALRDSLLTKVSGGGSGLAIGPNSSVSATNLTIVGEGLGEGVRLFESTSSGTSSLTVDSSVIRGFPTSIEREFNESASGTLNVTVRYSNSGPVVDSGTPSGTVDTSTGNINADPRFVDPAARDYRIRYDSPGIDTGNPGLVVPPPALDLGQMPRVVNGRVDMGAHEYQRRAPSAAIAGPDAATAGQPVGFSAQGSSDPDPGDPLSYSWNFGDGTSGTGAAPTHAFGSAGTYTVTVTVTDPTGQSASASKTVQVAGAGGGGGGGGVLPDLLAPRFLSGSVTALWAVNSRGRAEVQASGRRRVPRGGTFRFRLSEAARVVFRIERVLPGRRRGTRCIAGRRTGRRCTAYQRFGSFAVAGRAGANTKRFSGRIRAGRRTRALAPGRHRATLVATDAAGNRSVARRLFFRIVRP